MVDGTMYENRLEHFYTLFVDVFVFFAKSFIYILEALYLTLLPDRFRKHKVRYEIKPHRYFF